MAGVQAHVLRGGGRKTKGGSRSQTTDAVLLLLFIYLFCLFQLLEVTKGSSNQERKGGERLLPSVSGRTAHHVLLMGINMPSSETRSQVTVGSRLETTQGPTCPALCPEFALPASWQRGPRAGLGRSF